MSELSTVAPVPAVHDFEGRAGLRLAQAVSFVVAVTTLLGWCFSDRTLFGDELGLFNPTFMAYSTGKVSYPMHGQWDYMTVHPPFLYWAVGMTMRLGLSPVQAAGLHSWVLLVAILFLVLTSRLELRLKLCIPTALLMTVAFFGQYTLRPEVPILLSWLAGIVALENARTTAWRAWPLAAGGFFLAYASGLHYWSFLACLSCLPYAAVVLRDLGLRGAAMKTLPFLAGAALFALPFLYYFLIPEWTRIMDMLNNTGSTGSVAAAYGSHLEVIGHFKQFVRGSWLMPSSLLFLPVYVLGVVPICLALGILLMFRSTRVMIIASLPLPLFVALCIQRKAGPFYLLPEIHLWFLSLLLIGHALCCKIIHLASGLKWRTLGPATATVAVSVYALLLGTREVSALDLVVRADVLAAYRAAGRELMPDDSLLLFNSNSHWYTGGGTDICFYTVWGQSWDEFSHLLPRQAMLLFRDHWLGNQQCAVPFPHWYLQGNCRLRGFTLGKWDFLGVYVSKEAGPVRGYWLSDERVLHSFREDPKGEHVLVALKTERQEMLPDALSNGLIRLEDPRKSPLCLALGLYTLDNYRRLETELRSLGTIRDAVRGTLTVVDSEALLADLHQNDRPIRFHRTLPEAAAAFSDRQETSPGQAINLRPLLDRPKVELRSDDAAYKLTTNHSQDDWQMEADLAVTPHTLYRFQFDLEVLQGGVFVHIFDADAQRYLYSFSRPERQPRSSECFLFNSGSATRIRLGIANNLPNGRPGQSKLVIDGLRFSALPDE